MRKEFTKPVRGGSNASKWLTKQLASLLAKPFQKSSQTEKHRIAQFSEGMNLYDSGGRKYLNTAERRRFLEASTRAKTTVRLFCLMLIWSGCRISEALALVPLRFDLESGTVEFETLKRRRRGIVRQIPLPSYLLDELNRVFKLEERQRDPKLSTTRLWSFSRSTAWRHVKKIMGAADVHGSSAMPKGLRHTFGVAAFKAVPPHLVQRWLGHASLRTTAIYGDVSGPEERSFAERVWRDW